MSLELPPVEFSENCIGCGGTPVDRNIIMSYQHLDPLGPEFLAGNLCVLCQQQIESILDHDLKTECEWCGAPLPEGHRRLVMEFDENDTLHRTWTLCNDCLQNSY